MPILETAGIDGGKHREEADFIRGRIIRKFRHNERKVPVEWGLTRGKIKKEDEEEEAGTRVEEKEERPGKANKEGDWKQKYSKIESGILGSGNRKGNYNPELTQVDRRICSGTCTSKLIGYLSAGSMSNALSGVSNRAPGPAPFGMTISYG